MGRYARLLFILLGAWLTVAVWATPLFADMVIHPGLFTPHFFSTLAWMMCGTFAITVIIEYSVIYWMLGRPVKGRLELLLWLLLINAITNPAVQYAFIAIDSLRLPPGYSFSFLVFPIEFLVVVVEFGLFLWAFRWLYRRGALTEPITEKRTFVISLTANLASFGLGFVVFTAVEIAIFGFRIIGRGW
jgi:hypothetical protein